MAASDKSVAVSSSTDFSSDSTISDDWQELTKSDYAKVIFSDLLCNAESGTVECKFQITDNVHEDPSDYIGLFRIGYDDLSQCLASKMLSQAKCEDDGKLQRCVFTTYELPFILDGFYQFLYVTRDQEVCGASMPFQIKMPLPLRESLTNSSASENMDGGFLLVNEERNGLVEQNARSEQMKKEIAACISQNPDYYSLIEQIKEYTFTIHALQQSKDLAMREVTQLYESLNKQNNELIQLKSMLAAYEEKNKMSQCIQDEKSQEINQLRNELVSYKEKTSKETSLREEKNAEIAEMRNSLTNYEEIFKLHETLQKELEAELNRVKNESLLQEEQLKASLSFQEQQSAEISDLKRELEEMKKMQKAKVAAEAERLSICSGIQKAQDFVRIVTDSINNLDYTDENEMEKFFQLKIQLLIILKKMTRVTDLVNTCDGKRIHKSTLPSTMKKDARENSSAGSILCAPENRDPVETIVANTSTHEVEKIDIPTSSVESTSLLSSSEKEAANEDASMEVVQRDSFNKPLQSEVLEHQIIELPRLDVINEDTAKTLQTDKPLIAEDIAVINRLTENIIKRGCNLYETIELAEDSVSESGSDISEISECSSSIKKDMLCVSRVLAALSSYISNKTSLDHLVVVGKQEDKSLMHKNKWDVLLQKCALRYQIELLLEHIEKQKEGVKKLSEKICDLLTNCMLLKDEVTESKADCEKLQSLMARKDKCMFKLRGELEFKNIVLGKLHGQKKELERRTESVETTAEDFRARLMEASHIYKKQYTEIGRLSKKLQKYKSVKHKTASSKGESSLISSDSSKASSSFEVVTKDSVQNINDSDTGEHMFQKASLISKEKNDDSKPSHPDNISVQSYLDVLNNTASLCDESYCNTPAESLLVKDEEIQAQIDSNTGLKTFPERCLTLPAPTFDEDVECHLNQIQTCESALILSDFASYQHFQEVIKESFSNVKRSSTSMNSQKYSMSCYLCKETIHLSPESHIDLINHLEYEHSTKTCPVCGQLFEDAIPPKYFHIHVEQHFEI